MKLKNLYKLKKAKKEMLPGVERAIMRLAETAPDLVKALNSLAKSVNSFVSSSAPTVGEPIKLDESCTCHGKGWDFYEEDGRIILERCDACKKYKTDTDAAVAIEPLLQSFAGRVIKEDS